MALDYILEEKKMAKIPVRLVPVLFKLIKKSISNKYESVKFDSELIDLDELSDLINGGST